MNYQYRKLPVIIEAFQMTMAHRADNSEWPSWLHEAWNREPGENAVWIDPGDVDSLVSRLVVGTREGSYRIQWNDWIIRGIHGELYPCDPAVFAATYEEVTK